MMEIAGYIGALIVGLTLGLIGGGGSVLTVPILVYLFRVDTVLEPLRCQKLKGRLLVNADQKRFGVVLQERSNSTSSSKSACDMDTTANGTMESAK